MSLANRDNFMIKTKQYINPDVNGGGSCPWCCWIANALCELLPSSQLGNTLCSCYVEAEERRDAEAEGKHYFYSYIIGNPHLLLMLEEPIWL